MTRKLPDVEKLLLADVLTDVTNRGTRIPADVATQLPFRAVYKLGGTAPLPGFMDRPQVQIVTMAATREAASDAAEVAREALHAAADGQTRFANGVIHKVTEVISPFEVRTSGQPDGVFRFDQTVQLYTRP